MTVSSTIIKTSPFAGDGTNQTIPFTWQVWKTSEIKVILRTVATGAEEVLTEGTSSSSYAVTLSSDLPSAGNVKPVTAYSSLFEIVIKSDFPQTQEVDYVPGDKFPAESHEEALDRSVRLSQQLQEQFGRAVLWPETTTLEDVELPEIQTSNIGFFLSVNSAATGIVWGEPTDLGNLTAHNTSSAPHQNWIASDNEATGLSEVNAVMSPANVASAFPFQDGDILGISWTPSTYVPDTSPAESNDATDLTAHLKGIDDNLALVSGKNYVYVYDKKTKNTGGGTFNNGAWRTRDLNQASDTYNIATLAGNQITLNAGTYEVIGSAPAFTVSDHFTRLQNVTAGTTLMQGTNAHSNSADNTSTESFLLGEIVVVANQALELQHMCQGSVATVGFGDLNNTASSEAYSMLRFRQHQ